MLLSHWFAKLLNQCGWPNCWPCLPIYENCSFHVTLYKSAAKPSRSQETWEVYLLSLSPLNKANIRMNRIVVFKKKGILSSILFRASATPATLCVGIEAKGLFSFLQKENFVAEVFLPVNFFKRFLHLKEGSRSTQQCDATVACTKESHLLEIVLFIQHSCCRNIYCRWSAFKL